MRMAPSPIRLLCTLGVSFLAGGVADAAPRVEARTYLRHCGFETCLMVTGRRPDSSAVVTLGDHRVPVSGARNWRVAVPLQTVRTWFPPSTRTITVHVSGADGGTGGGEAIVPLPIGLLFSGVQLASLEVRAR